jgi:uncharacterized SAM-binding protein YcdF (DUF218 family)
MNGNDNGRLPASSSLSTRSRSSRLLRWFIQITSVGVLAFVIWCSTLYFIITHFDGTPKGDSPLQADVGIVLGATLWNNEPSPGLRERLDHGLELYRSGVFKSFIVTGGLDDNGATLTEAEGMRNYLIEQGVPADDIVMDSLSRSTYGNLVNSEQLMNNNGWGSAVIITHSYHGSRAANIAAKLGFKPVQVSVTDSKVLNLSYHDTREVLAYTKWLAMKLFL